MKNAHIFACCVVLVAGLAGGIAFAEKEPVTMNGQFVWERNDKNVPGDIEAVFTPTGKGTWEVVFHFEWEGEMRAWKGEARGKLGKGKLEGEAIEDRGRERKFAFNGAFEDGVFKGDHGSIRDGEMQRSGTITFE